MGRFLCFVAVLLLLQVQLNQAQWNNWLSRGSNGRQRASNDGPVLINPASIPTDSDCNGVMEFDLMFVNDESASIGAYNYPKSLNFMAEIVKGFKKHIDAGSVRVGVLTYGEVSELRIPLGQYSFDSLSSQIKNLQYANGPTTMTGEAIDDAAAHVLGSTQSDRPQYIMVITDGASRGSPPGDAADRARSQGIELIAVGINDYNIDELMAIAGNDPNAVKEVQDFDALAGIAEEVSQTVCRKAHVVEECNGVMEFDLMFVNDESASIGAYNYPKSLNFMSEIIKGFKKHINAGTVRIGVLTYGEISELRIPLGQYSFASLSSQIKNLQYANGPTTMTGEAIDDAAAHVVGNRISNRPQYIMVITDGESRGSPPGDAADRARAQDITLSAVGINDYNLDELMAIAGQNKNLVLEVEDFDALAGIAEDVSKTLCNTVNEINSNDDCEGTTEFDVMFVNDESASIGAYNYPKSLNFISEILKGFKKQINLGRVEVGVLTYGEVNELRIPLGQYSFASLSSTIKNLPYANGPTTMTGEAIEAATQHVVRNTRTNRKRYMIVITDGESRGSPPGIAADAARAQGIAVIAVGINQYNYDELLAIAGGIRQAVTEVENFDALAGMAKNVLRNICPTAPEDVVFPDTFTCSCCPNAPPPYTAPTSCINDIIVAVDGSACFRDQHDKMTTFVDRLVRQIARETDLGYNGLYRTRLGITQFSSTIDTALEISAFDDFTDPDDNLVLRNNILRALQQMKFLGEGSYLDRALNKIGKQLHKNPRRKDLLEEMEPREPKKIIVLLTNGNSHPDVTMNDLEKSIRRLEKLSVTVIPVAVTRECHGGEGTAWEDGLCPNTVVLNKLAAVGRDSAKGFYEMKSNTAMPGVIKELKDCKDEGLPPNGLKQCDNNTCSCNIPYGPAGPVGRPGETTLGERGDQGPPGQSGEPGFPGPMGEDGQKGRRGRRGPRGDQGTSGEPGVPGERGLIGLPGFNGGRGQIGIPGIPGELGPKGNRGPGGSVGVPGEPGRPGRNGRNGEDGAPGNTGPAGRPGAPGIAVRGPDGERGLKGRSGYSGATGVPGENGNDGEPGTCGRPGEAGPQGERGPQGRPGLNGDQGPRGAEGRRGANGENGANGFNGEQGLDGVRGEPGEQGRPGPPGPQGETGPQGDKGEANFAPGPRGVPGLPGPTGPRGIKGPNGSDGKEGRRGNAGPKGPPGFAGVQGDFDYDGLRPFIRDIVTKMIPRDCGEFIGYT